MIVVYRERRKLHEYNITPETGYCSSSRYGFQETIPMISPINHYFSIGSRRKFWRNLVSRYNANVLAFTTVFILY